MWIGVTEGQVTSGFIQARRHRNCLSGLAATGENKQLSLNVAGLTL